MKISRRIGTLATREVKRFAAHAAMRASRTVESIRKQRFRPLTEAETAATLGDELLRALSDLRRRP